MVFQTMDIPRLLVETVIDVLVVQGGAGFTRCRCGEDSRAPSVALVEKLVAFPDREFGHCLGQLIIAVMS